MTLTTTFDFDDSLLLIGPLPSRRLASKDPVVLKRFFEVANLLRSPTAMLDPAIALRVLLGGRGTAQATPEVKR